jgi:hypothetical protein
MIRSGNRVLAQIVKRISELNYIESQRTPQPEGVLQIKCDTRNDSFYMADDNETVIKVVSVTKGEH